MSGHGSVQRGHTAAAEWVALGGRYRIRIREIHVRDRLGPLLSRAADGAAKVDLLLRGIASLPAAGGDPGLIPDVSWARLHDLVRDAAFYGGEQNLKRKWVSEQLAKLEKLQLIRRERVRGSRPRLIVLCDDGSGAPFDDPGAGGSAAYVTALGSVIEHGRLSRWGGADHAMYLCALAAERYARSDLDMAARFGLADKLFGDGVWYRPLRWFEDRSNDRPASHIRFPFSERTLRRGVQSLAQDGLIAAERIWLDPRTGRSYAKGPRTIYHNGFARIRENKRLTIYPGTTDRETKSILGID